MGFDPLGGFFQFNTNQSNPWSSPPRDSGIPFLIQPQGQPKLPTQPVANSTSSGSSNNNNNNNGSGSGSGSGSGNQGKKKAVCPSHVNLKKPTKE
jgi:hypothetical protein